MRTPAFLDGSPIPVRCAAMGSMLFGGIGLVVGLIVGLNVYVRTAWFAAFEIGLPAAILGGLLGLLIGLAASGVLRRWR